MNDSSSSKAIDLLQEPYEKFCVEMTKLYELISIVGYGTERDDLMTKLKLYLWLKHMKDTCKSIESACNIELEKISTAAAKIMQSEGEEQKRAYGYSFTPDTDTKINCPKEQKENLIVWMKAHELGRELVKEEVHPMSLISFVKKLQSTDAPIPPMVTTYDLPVLTVRKLPAKKA